MKISQTTKDKHTTLYLSFLFFWKKKKKFLSSIQVSQEIFLSVCVSAYQVDDFKKKNMTTY